MDNGLLDDHVHVIVKTSGVWAYNYLSMLHLHVSQLHSCHSSLRTPHNLFFSTSHALIPSRTQISWSLLQKITAASSENVVKYSAMTVSLVTIVDCPLRVHSPSGRHYR
jgi:hypothetical protein